MILEMAHWTSISFKHSRRQRRASGHADEENLVAEVEFVVKEGRSNDLRALKNFKC